MKMHIFSGAGKADGAMDAKYVEARSQGELHCGCNDFERISVVCGERRSLDEDFKVLIDEPSRKIRSQFYGLKNVMRCIMG